jgi:hypothetical protein
MSLGIAKGVGYAAAGLGVIAVAGAFIGIGFYGHVFQQMGPGGILLPAIAGIAATGFGTELIMHGGSKAKKAWDKHQMQVLRNRPDEIHFL